MNVSGPPAYLSAAEAARACGVSERTIRRWVMAGRLAADTSGPTLRIPAVELRSWQAAMSGLSANGQASPLCPDVRQALHSEHSTSVTDTETARPDLTALVDLVAKLNADLVAKAEAAAMWQTRAAVLEAELARLRDLAALGPGRDEIVMTVPSSRPWWAFWRR